MQLLLFCPVQIEQRQIDFWSVSQEEMKRREERTYPYPPHFIITVNGKLAETDINARFIFEGTEPVIEQEILLQASSHSKAQSCMQIQLLKKNTQNSRYCTLVDTVYRYNVVLVLLYPQTVSQWTLSLMKTRVTLTFHKALSHKYVTQ